MTKGTLGKKGFPWLAGYTENVTAGIRGFLNEPLSESPDHVSGMGKEDTEWQTQKPARSRDRAPGGRDVTATQQATPQTCREDKLPSGSVMGLLRVRTFTTQETGNPHFSREHRDAGHCEDHRASTLGSLDYHTDFSISKDTKNS